MISFEEFAEIYHNSVDTDSFEYKHIEKIYLDSVEQISKLDSNREYKSGELKDILFSSIDLKSQTTFYKYRRMYQRIMTIEKFGYRTINEISKIEFEDVFNTESINKEYFKDHEDIINSIKRIQKVNNNINRNPVMALALIMWSGLTLTDARNVLVENINFDAKTLDISGVSVSINKETCDAIRNHMTDKGIVSGYLFPGRYGGKASITTVNKMITSLNSVQSEKRFISKNIYYSGMFYRNKFYNEEISDVCNDVKIKRNEWEKAFY